MRKFVHENKRRGLVVLISDFYDPKGFEEGINTAVEVTDARASLTRARGLHFQAIHLHRVARIGFALATGTLGPRAGQEHDDVDDEALLRLLESAAPDQP